MPKFWNSLFISAAFKEGFKYTYMTYICLPSDRFILFGFLFVCSQKHLHLKFCKAIDKSVVVLMRAVSLSNLFVTPFA